jgi:hypothetical protein
MGDEEVAPTLQASFPSPSTLPLGVLENMLWLLESSFSFSFHFIGDN